MADVVFGIVMGVFFVGLITVCAVADQRARARGRRTSVNIDAAMRHRRKTLRRSRRPMSIGPKGMWGRVGRR